ncbi:hypothetical protein B8V81_2006 [Paenibacillus pasadenensis]|uniref:Uncharacterized protein n=1 Tax=Paenibacillus pasadenensis TaxID=217090 RepID=A0A2N5MZR2_9BACL|nr:hypothetical protein B8V81_2006 [Paenibacillus pasadenensis]
MPALPCLASAIADPSLPVVLHQMSVPAGRCRGRSVLSPLCLAACLPL